MTHVLLVFLAWLLILAGPCVVAAERPNIVMVLADDLGWGELGCFGNPRAITPNLDRFATEGVRLTDCHSASSVCSPSRSAILTGRIPYRNGVFTWIPDGSPIHLRADGRTLPALLAAAGYDTCHVGKWHLNGLFNSPEQPQPSDHGYDWWLGTQNNAAPSHDHPTNFIRNGQPVGRADDYSAAFVVSEAIGWMQKRSDASAPFFLAIWTHEPHFPIASADRFEKLHAAVDDAAERTYLANVTQLDDAFGRLMKALDSMNLRDDTLVIFTSDNGPEGHGTKGPGRGVTGGLRGRKRSMYEGGHRVPGIIRWPGHIAAGTTSDVPVIGTDLFPTALQAAGVPVPPATNLDGVSRVPLFVGETLERTRPLVWRWGNHIAYREGDWKIVADDPTANAELYNLADDRAERSNLATGQPDRLAGMLTRLRAYLSEVEAEGPDWWKTEPMNPVEVRSPPTAAPAAAGP
ncbi:MAG: sulfatase family protein [Pirellulales bacterium]